MESASSTNKRYTMVNLPYDLFYIEYVDVTYLNIL